MIHLLKRIYVIPDFKAENNKKRIIVSKDFSAVENLKVTFDSLEPCLASCGTFDELIGQGCYFSSWKHFLQFIESEEKVYIYVDESASMKFFVMWVKTIMPNMSAAVAYRCYNTYVQRIKIQFPALLTNNSFLEYRKSQLLSYQLPSRQEFIQAFSSMSLDLDEEFRKQWIADNKSDLSIEWHLANYEIDKNHLAVFKQKYIQILIKACAIEVSEWYQYITKYFMQPKVRKELGIDFDWDNEDWHNQLKKCEKIAWMFDDELLYVSKNPSYFLVNIDKALRVGEVLQDFWFKDIKIDDHIRLLDEDYFESNHAQFVFSTLRRLASDLNYVDDDAIHQIIKEDKQFEEISIIFDLLQHVHKWNHYLVQYIDAIKGTKELEELRIC